MRLDATSHARRQLTADLRARIEHADPADGRCHLMVNRGVVQAIVFDAHDGILGIGYSPDAALAFDRAMFPAEALNGVMS